MDTEKVDFLKEDPVIVGQEVALISFVEPKNARLLQNKESFIATNFITHFLKSYKKTQVYQKEHSEEELTDELKETLDTSYKNIQKQYYEYQKFNLSKLENEFNTKHNKNKEPTVTGFKVRGVYPNQLVTKSKAEELHYYEPAINVFCIPVGKWVPYCPLNDQEVESEYQMEALNDLVKGKDDDMAKRDLEYEERKHKMKKKMNEENKLKKQKNLEEKNNDSDEEVQVEEIVDELYAAPVKTSSEKESEKKNKKVGKKNRKANNKRKINKKN
tara:strand:- start:6341 stop:7156 length:816 start_codon:yes stop_codon:yes gene_type:complete